MAVFTQTWEKAILLATALLFCLTGEGKEAFSLSINPFDISPFEYKNSDFPAEGNAFFDPPLAVNETFVEEMPLPGMEVIPAGSYIINMGVQPQTTGNSLKPYGLIYTLLQDHNIPIIWAINPGKAKDGVDFTYNGVDYIGGPFIILAEYRTAAINNVISSWEAQGVVGLTTDSDFPAPVNRTINYSMNWTLDLQNGAIAEKYLIAAGIPSTAYNWTLPGDLNCCNDVFVMPHADPDWANHNKLLFWNDNESNGGCRGAIWGGCKAVSDLENIFNPSNPSQRLNFLMEDAVAPATTPSVWSGDHDDGSGTYQYARHDHPIMQFLGVLDGSQENGAEQVYLPTTGWRPSTLIGVWDDNQSDVPSLSPGLAAKLAFGPAFGDTTRGYVVYEAAHRLDKASNPENFAAQRAFLNFSFMAAGNKAIQPLTLVPGAMQSGQVYNLTSTVTGGTGNYFYSWTTTCGGGTFSSPDSANTTFTAPSVSVTTECYVKLTVTDDCGTRTGFSTVHITLTPEDCTNGIDDDNDGYVDCFDPDCPCYTPFQCDGTLYHAAQLQSTTAGVGTAGDYILYELQQNPVQLKYLVNLTTQGLTGDISSFGYNPVDLFIYATGLQAPHNLYLISGNYEIMELGTITGIDADHTELVGADFHENGYFYVIASRLTGTLNQKIYKINLTTLAATEVVNFNGYPGMKDLAFNPVDKKFYGWRTDVHKLAAINPLNWTTTNIGAANPAYDAMESTFFTPQGKLLGYVDDISNGAPYTVETLVSMNAADGTISQAGYSNESVNSDGCSCPYQVKLTKAGPASAPNGSTITYVFKIYNETGQVLNNLTFTDSLPANFYFATNAHDVSSGLSITGTTNTKQIASLTLSNVPAGTSSFSIDVELPSCLVGGTSLSNQAWFEGMGSASPYLADKIASDDANTAALGDPTVTAIECVEICSNGLDDDSNGLADCEDPLCPDASGCNCILLVNGGFDETLSEWSTYGSVSATTDNFAGGWAAHISGFYAYVTQTQSGIMPGQVYTLTAYGKREGSVWASNIGIRFYNSSNTLLSENTVNVLASEYTRYEVSATAPANATKVQVFALKFGGGALMVDEFCLEEYVIAIGECILIHNEGFEGGLNNWQIAGGTVSNTIDAYSGASAVKIVSNGARFFQRLAVEVGKTYQMTVWAKIYGQPSYAGLSLEWKDVNNNTISSVLQPILFWDTEYRLFTLKGKAPAGAVYAEVGGYKEGGSSHILFADDFCFSLGGPLGGNNYDLFCGCSDNMVPNGGFEDSDVTSFPYSFEGIPAYAISPWNTNIVKPWYPGISSKYAFYLNDIYDQVNNPEGDRFVWLPNSGDCWIADMDFSNNLILEDGQTYRFCFYAATWAGSLGNDGFPDGGTEPQHPGILNLEFSFVSGFKPVFAWAVPSSESFNNLSWEKLEYTFTYNIQDPISNFVFTNARPGVGMAIDAVTLSKVVCQPIVECGPGGISFERWGNISGSDIADLTTSKNYPNNFDESGILPSFQGPANYDNNYGTRVYGHLIPPETGDYQFNLTANNSGRLFLSSDETFANKESIASAPAWTNVTEYTKYPEQTSATISLEAGKKYYIELLHKESTGSDHFQVYWKTPSNGSWVIIPGTALSPICHPEICYNNLDDDFDGLTDCEDDECGPVLVGNYFTTDENCGSGGGAIDISPLAADLPLSYQWSDMSETAWWTFEETPNDVSGNVNHPNGIAGYPIYSTDAVQGRFSAYFNGSTYIRYSVDNGFMEKEFDKLTVAMWIKPSDLTGIKTLFDEGGSTGGKGLAIRLTNNVITAGVKNGGTLFSDATHVLTGDGLWHHVAAVFDKGKFTVYLDGVAGPTITTNFNKVKKHGNNGGLAAPVSGSVLNSGNTFYVGLMDDVRYYHKKALTPNQIADLAANTGDRSNLLAGTYSITLSSASGCSTSANMNIASSSNFTNGGTISGDEIKCLATYDGSLITSLSPPSGGGSGPTEYKWESSTDSGSTWAEIDSAADATYDPPVISSESMYRRGSRLSPCLDWVFSNTITKSFTVNFTSPGALSGNESSCGAFDPAPIASISGPSGGGTGATEFVWEQSTGDGATWTIIAGATNATYDPPGISQITQYRRGARRNPCDEFLYTGPVQKTVVTPLTDAGSIVGTESNCGSFDPEVIGSIPAPTGGEGGVIQYQWQKSTDGVLWADVTGANAETFNPTTVIQTTQYRRGARRSPCADFIYSDVIFKNVVSNFTAGGYISADEVNCGGYDPALITSLAGPSGGVNGSIFYRWQKSTDSGATWVTISGATAGTYDPGFISQTTNYRRQAQRSPCSAWINSNTVKKTVKPVPVSVISTFPAEDNGYLCEFGNYVFKAADAGPGATYTWNFGSFATPQTANGIGPHSVSFNVPGTTPYTNVSAILTAALDGCAASDTLPYKVRPQIVVTNVTSTDPTTCNVSDGTISVTANYPSGAAIKASIDGGTIWIAPPFNYTVLSGGIYELRLRYAGQECELVWGNITLTEPTSIVPGITLSTLETCAGTAFTMEATVQGGSGPFTYNWNFGATATPASATGPGPHTVSISSGGIKSISLSVQDSFCYGYVDTAIAIVTNYTDGGNIDGAEDLCANVPGSTIASLSTPIGSFGGAGEYQWEKHEDDGNGGWTAWAEIAGATADTLSPGIVPVSMEYRRKARRSPCSGWVYSNVILKRISGAPAPNSDLYSSACPGLFFSNNVSENDNNLTNPVYSIFTLPTNGTLDMDPDGEFIYTPNSAFCGSDQFTYQVCNNGTSCCDTASVIIDLADSQAPVLQNIPANVIVHCDDEIPLPPIVNAWENCQSVSLVMDESSNQGGDSCSVYSFDLTRIWTAQDYCGNNVADQQTITILDDTAPDIYRIYTLPNGKRMVAGVMENVTQRWKTIRFPVQFGSKPIVFAQVTTKNDPGTVITRMRSISTSQFQLRLQEQENSDGLHAEENVAWIAIEEGTNATGLPFEVKKRAVSSEAVSQAFSVALPAPAFLATIQTFNENNPVNLRYDSLTSSGVSIQCQEETSFDPEANHGYETAGYLALGNAGDLTSDEGEVIGETGSLSVTQATQTITLAHTYHNPVVVFGGISLNETDPATIRVKNVGPSSFEVEIEEWEYLDGIHAAENLTYIVVEGSVPFDQTLECSAIPDAPVIGVNMVGLDNCDVSVALTISESPFSFDCLADTLFTRQFHVQDECGNFTTYTQTFILRDTTPPEFTVPEDLVLTCAIDFNDPGITGDVTDENDNCAEGLEAIFTDNVYYLNGCTGYILRIWSLTDYCGNTTIHNQKIIVYNENDADGDGLADQFDLDDDNDGIPDAREGGGDTDDDGIPNSLDIDSDNDGIPDIIEAGFEDKNGDGIVDKFGQPDWDVDGDGLANDMDGNETDTSAVASDTFDPLSAIVDRDGDGIPNFLDSDSDNDGIPDLIEAGGVDTDGDGVIDYPILGDASSLPDADGDGFYDAYDPDDDSSFGVDNPGDMLVADNNGIYTGGQAAWSPDQDGDGVPDFLDSDSDNDGIPDLIEAGGVDTDGDGKIDPAVLSDTTGKGFDDTYRNNVLILTSGDGATLDGRPEDTNGNGTAYETGDIDGDGIPNARDADCDNDGINDIIEAGFATQDPNGTGSINLMVDGDGNGFDDASVGNIYTEPDGIILDGRPEDTNDPDSSAYNSVANDGDFGQLNGQPDVDDDGDSVPNFADPDSDGDLIYDVFEDTNGNGIMDPGETGYLNTDSDGDLIADGLEDANQNGVFNIGIETDPTDIDTDNDGIPDGVEDANQNGVVDPGGLETNPRDPCDPLAGTTCIGVYVKLKVKLYGALIENNFDTLMRDDLRAKGLLPTTEPYAGMPGFEHVGVGGGEVVALATFLLTGPNAIVDWVFIELRLGSDAQHVVATRSALLQRDGDVVDLDGSSPVYFTNVPSGDYYVVVRHRNHLGLGTQDPMPLSPTPNIVNFADYSLNAFGNNPGIDVGGQRVLWSGDLNSDRKVIYQGPGNDVQPIFFHVITHWANTYYLANFISQSYNVLDLDLDGKTIFQGPGNDRSKVLFRTVLNSPENMTLLANFVVTEKLP
jgi:uncharacterized repeat protein (TIGR01451 family)